MPVLRKELLGMSARGDTLKKAFEIVVPLALIGFGIWAIQVRRKIYLWLSPEAGGRGLFVFLRVDGTRSIEHFWY